MNLLYRCHSYGTRILVAPFRRENLRCYSIVYYWNCVQFMLCGWTLLACFWISLLCIHSKFDFLPNCDLNAICGQLLPTNNGSPNRMSLNHFVICKWTEKNFKRFEFNAKCIDLDGKRLQIYFCIKYIVNLSRLVRVFSSSYKRRRFVWTVWFSLLKLCFVSFNRPNESHVIFLLLIDFHWHIRNRSQLLVFIQTKWCHVSIKQSQMSCWMRLIFLTSTEKQ